MPVHACTTEDGRPGFAYGGQHCYGYDPDDEASKREAERKAHVQGYVIEQQGAKALALTIISGARENPYHDELGRFTFAEGGGYSRAGAIAEPVAPAKNLPLVTGNTVRWMSENDYSHEAFTANVARAVADATPEQRGKGLRDYEEYRAAAEDMAAHFEIEPNVVIGMIAATSPQREIEDNFADIEHVLTQLATLPPEVIIETSLPALAQQVTPGPVLPANIIKALRIYQGEQPDAVLRGNKVRSFYSNLTDPAGSQAVTLDTHMVRAITGDERYDTDSAGTVTTSAGKYAALSAAVRRVAAEEGLLPSQVQAIVWEYQRAQPSKSVGGYRSLADALAIMSGAKFNPNHDELGRFSEGPGGGANEAIMVATAPARYPKGRTRKQGLYEGIMSPARATNVPANKRTVTAEQREEITRVTASRASDDIETGQVWYSDGHSLVRVGDERRIVWNKGELLNASVQIHNHPKGGGPSLTDILTSQAYRIPENIVTTTEYTYRFGPPKGGWTAVSRTAIIEAARAARVLAEDLHQARDPLTIHQITSRDEEWTIGPGPDYRAQRQQFADWSDKILREVAERTGIQYERTPVEKQ